MSPTLYEPILFCHFKHGMRDVTTVNAAHCVIGKENC